MKGISRSQHSREPVKARTEVLRSSLRVSPDGAAGVGGFAGMKNEGTQQMDAWGEWC